MSTTNYYCVGKNIPKTYGVGHIDDLTKIQVRDLYRSACTKLAGVFSESISHSFRLCQMIAKDDGVMRIVAFGTDDEGKVSRFNIVFDKATMSFSFDNKYLKYVEFDVLEGEDFDVEQELSKALRDFVSYVSGLSRPLSLFEFPIMPMDLEKDSNGVWKYRTSNMVTEGKMGECSLEEGTGLVVLLNWDNDFYEEYGGQNYSGTTIDL